MSTESKKIVEILCKAMKQEEIVLSHELTAKIIKIIKENEKKEIKKYPLIPCLSKATTVEEQIYKIVEEIFEVIGAFLRKNRANKTNEEMALELIDVQTACETLLTQMGYDEKEKNLLRYTVIMKNALRGYYQ